MLGDESKCNFCLRRRQVASAHHRSLDALVSPRRLAARHGNFATTSDYLHARPKTSRRLHRKPEGLFDEAPAKGERRGANLKKILSGVRRSLGSGPGTAG